MVGLVAIWGLGCGGGASNSGEGGRGGGAAGEGAAGKSAGAGGSAVGGGGGGVVAGGGGSAVGGRGGSLAGGGGSAVAGSGGNTVAGRGGSAVAGSGIAGSGGGSTPPAPPLQFDISVVTNPVVPGGRLLYVITVGNVSTHAVDGVGLTMRVPTGLQFVYSTDVYPNSAGCSVCTANLSATWALGSLAAGVSRTVMVNAQVLQTVGEGDSIASMFTLAATGQNAINVTKTVSVHGAPAGQLALGTATSPVVPNQRFTFDLDVGETGPTALANAELRLALPAGLSVVAISDGGTAPAAGDVAWTLGTLTSAVHRSVDVVVDRTLPAGSILVARAKLTYDGGVDVDAFAEQPVSVVAAPLPLKVDISVASNPVQPAGRLLYTITLGNVSTRALEGVGIVLRTPAGLQFVYSTDADPNSAGCSVCTEGLEADWNLGTLAAGASQTITLNASVLASEVGDGALIRAPFVIGATDMNLITAVNTTQVFGRPAAQLALGAVTNQAVPGQAFTFDIDVGQIGAAALTGTTLRAVLPTGVTVGTIGDGGTQPAPGEVVWSVGGLAVGGALHRSLPVVVDAATLPGAILAPRVQLTYEGGVAVDATAEYAASVVVSDPPLKLTVGAAPNPGVPGTRLLYTATLSNTSARAVDTIGLMLRTPAGIQYVYSTDAEPNSAGCSVCTADLESTWSFASLPVSGVQVVTINANLLATVVEGSLISATFKVGATALMAPLFVKLTVPTHR